MDHKRYLTIQIKKLPANVDFECIINKVLES